MGLSKLQAINTYVEVIEPGFHLLRHQSGDEDVMELKKFFLLETFAYKAIQKYTVRNVYSSLITRQD